MNRAVAGLNQLSSPLKRRLRAAGFEWTNDLRGMDADALVQEAGIDRASAQQVLHAAFKGFAAEPAILQPPAPRMRLRFGCPELDLLFSKSPGGLLTGHLYELCGVSGIGISQICMQLCTQVQLAPALGGLHGRAIYIDTECAYVAARQATIAWHVLGSHDFGPPPDGASTESRSGGDPVARALANIAVYRVTSPVELIALTHILDDVVDANPGVRLLVLDSLPAPLVGGHQGHAQAIVRQLRGIAEKHRLVVVFTSKLGPRRRVRAGIGGPVVPDPGAATAEPPPHHGGVGRELERDLTELSPPGIDQWMHLVDAQANFFWDDVTRVAFLQKGPCMNRFARFQVTDKGVEPSSAEPQDEDSMIEEMCR